MTIGPNGIWPVPDTCPPARSLYIAIPTRDNVMAYRTTVSVASLCMYLSSLGVDVMIDSQPGSPFVDHARNTLVTRFMRSEASDLLFWDSDVDCGKSAADAIVTVRRPFVSGIYPKKTDANEWPVVFESNEVELDADGLISTVKFLPAGFLRLNRCVFDALPHEPYQTDDGSWWLGYFPSPGPRRGRYQGEDFGFCQKWRDRGGKCYLIPNLSFGHTGIKTWIANWAKEQVWKQDS